MTGAKGANPLLAHELGTYYSLRIVLAWIGFMLPVVVALTGWFQCAHPPQLLAGSLSAYYHRTARVEFFTPRDFFVGGLLAAATCLYAYKGFSTKENVVLNLAAVFAIGVALLPTGHGPIAGSGVMATNNCVVFMGAGYEDARVRPILHAASAILFFACLAYVSIWRSRDTLRLLHDATKADRYNRGYFLAGLAMVASPVFAVLVNTLADASHPILIFAIETAGVWAFCAYWALKSREMHETRLDARVARGEVERVTVESRLPRKAVDRALRKIQVGGAERVERIVPVAGVDH